MQSTASVVMGSTVSLAKRQRPALRCSRALGEGDAWSGFILGLQHLAATIEAGRADVVAQVRFARRRFNCNARHIQCVVRAMHATLGRRLLVLLDSHEGLLDSLGLARRAPAGWIGGMALAGVPPVRSL